MSSGGQAERIEPEVPPETRGEVRWRARQQLPQLLGLVLLWMLLWGAFTWLGLVTGIVLALLVARVFYLPAVELGARLHPVWVAVFVGRFVIDLVQASVQVAVLAFRGVDRNAVVAVQLASRSDLMTTLTAIAISLIPGSVVVEVDREESILYLHVLNTDREADLVRARANVLSMERRIIRSVGSPADLERISG